MKIVIPFILIVTAVACTSEKSKGRLNYTETAIKMAIDTLTPDMKGGYWQYFGAPDGTGDIYMQEFTEFFTKGNPALNKNSLEESLREVLNDTTKYEMPPLIQNNDWTLKFTPFSDSLKRDMIGVFHVSELKFYDSENAFLYYSFQCGNKCGKGYLLDFGLRNETLVLKRIYTFWSANPQTE